MSRIEKAMERAAQLRKGDLTPVKKQTDNFPDNWAAELTQAEHRPTHIHTPPPVPEEKIVSDSPFLVNLNAPSSPIGEEFRKLKSALVKLTTGDDFKNTILVTSAVPNEGKSITALNLAISLAQEYDHTVLLIDADFRRPSIHSYLGIELNRGFSDCLLGDAQIGDVIIPTGIGRLSIVTAGSEVSNPVELFASQKTEELITEIKNRYHDRFIIFDSPPVLPFAEARTLAHLADGVLFVVKEHLASMTNVKEAIDALKGSEILGMVYNDAIINGNDERYTRYQYYDRTKS